MSHGSMTLVGASEANPASRLDTLPPWPWDDPLDPRAPMTLGWGVVLWAESTLIQPNGPRAGKPFRLTPRQLRFWLWWYAMDDEGRWLWDHGVRRLAKGSGKSPFAGATSLAEFCGPVRLDRKDDRRPGRCVGRPVHMPWIQITATAESQTKNTMRMVRAFAPKGSKIVTEYQLDPGKTIYYKVPEGTLEITTSSAGALEGAETSFVVGDETENWKPSHQGDELAETHADNLAKSGSRMLETSNAWEPGAESVAEKTWDAWVAQEEGRVREGGGRILYDAVVAPPDTDLADYDSLRAGLEFVYADCPWVDIDTIIGRIWSPKAKPSESKRKYLNWPTVSETAWLDPREWQQLAEPRKVTAREEIVLFFDGSRSRDATALVACCVSDGHVFVPRTVDGQRTIWEPDPEHTSEDIVPAADVDRAVDHVFDTHNVVAFFADVKEWESFTKVTWPERYAERLRVKAVPGGKDPQAIAWDMRSHVRDFTLAAELVHSEITGDEPAFTHDDDPVLARHVANARNSPNRWGTSISKETPDSRRKIDAAVCMVGARMVRHLVAAAPKPKKRTGSLW
ncbi:MAG: terminase [Actinomycetota bacterium]